MDQARAEIRDNAVKLLGVSVNAMTIDELNGRVRDAIERRARLLVGSQNLHGVYEYHRTAEMRQFQSDALVRIDGMPLVFVAKLCGLPVRREHRITWVDWLDPLFRCAADSGWTIYYCGARDEVIERAKIVVAGRYPTLRFLGRSGYFSTPDEEVEFVRGLNELRADILIVGMGMPRQERFVLSHAAAIEAPVLLTSGAAIEYLAGNVKTPPRWMGRLGLEWLYRLSENPKRFGRRYLIEPWALVPWLLRDLWHYRVRGERP